MNIPFQLVGLQHHGQALDWQWDGSAAQAETPLSQALHTLDAISPAVREQIHALRLQRQRGASADTWWLYGASGHWVCTLNGKALPHQQTVRLSDGDVIEIGFVRLQVRLQSDPQLISGAGQAPSLSASEAAPAEQSHFELTDLAESEAGRKSPEGLQKPDDDISDLISDLISDRAAQTMFKPLPDSAVGTDSATTTALADKVIDDPLSLLHEAYLRRLRSPLFNDPQEQWQSIQRNERMTTQDPLQHLQTLAGVDAGLSDLLGQTNNINVTMDGFDAFSAVDILAPEPFDSLMHLFAPEEFVPPQPAQFVDNAERMDALLPSLTRREHHSLSLDSAMPIQKAKP